MKKVLFLSYNYPYGNFGPSTNCTTRIMRKLAENKDYEVHCLSYMGVKKNYEDIPNVNLLQLTKSLYSQGKKTKIYKKIELFLKIPFYPLYTLIRDYQHYKICKRILKKQKFDLVVAQCFPEESWFSGVLLKKNGYCNKLMVIFWDNIYGLIPKYLPENFVLRRQRKVESWIAKHADKLVSLYPIQKFHKEYGEISNAVNKRVYLGIPAIIKPPKQKETEYREFVLSNKINVLYSGTLYSTKHINYFVELLNSTSIVENINLILLVEGLSKEDEIRLKQHFKGEIQISGWIPLKDLMILYHHVDLFLSFPGISTAIRSKVYEYMSYGKPLILCYEHDNDVNKFTFSSYPLCLSLDIRYPILENVSILEQYVEKNNGKIIPFETIETLYKKDTPLVYVELIDEIMN